MDSESTRLLNQLNLVYTKRWVIAPMLRDQSVAEHCYRVQALVRLLHHHMDPPGFRLSDAILMALDHDHIEAVTGDTPGAYKDQGMPWKDPDGMLGWEQAVRVADALESYDWWSAWGMGNWVHPFKPAIGRDNRDLRKIRHYCGVWVGMADAVRIIMKQYLGYEDCFIQEVMGDHGKPAQ